MFRPVEKRQGETCERLCRIPRKEFVYVERITMSKAKRDPVFSGHGLGKKILDTLHESGERNACVIPETPTSVRSGSQTDQE